MVNYLNQLKNADTVIYRFEQIKQNHLRKLLNFTMKDFYPYIAESILKKRLYFAEIHIRITKEKQALLLTIPKLTLH